MIQGNHKKMQKKDKILYVIIYIIYTNICVCVHTYIYIHIYILDSRYIHKLYMHIQTVYETLLTFTQLAFCLY